MHRILIIEDEKKISRLLQLELEHEGYQTTMASDGLTGLELIQNEEWDLVILDVMLPGLNGIEVLRRVRVNNQSLPIIMLTARDNVIDKVTGLDYGANDYLTKPFEIEELLARIRVCLRTQTLIEKPINQNENSHYQLSDLVLNVPNRTVSRENQEISLTRREYDLLHYLLQHEEQVMTREQIIEHVWGFDYYGDTNVVDVYIRYLRNKIDKPFHSPLIHTIRGVGYVIKEIKK
ncbi:response regulator transcription factor [Alkalihalobacillus trypoxylicola]|uniref:PhoB family transcriptional regulator n=1 Tax=Alkalihalobacillus trypoxylicola TaxID=519424 RepID=A0A162E5S3_9BACI|nr:response regulator transcription factor [Alkalihalobacillus trypoxylicola]KYG31806.1 PhoB family transcriptional regulator [Alkalihalobacillus trypoxylicola]